MLRERTGVTRLPSVPSCPRQAREAGDVAKIADPVSARATQTPSDAAGVATAITPAAISGPKMKATSMATASRAKAACLSSWSGTRPDQSVLIAFPVGRVPSPATVARAASATTGAPASAPPISPRKAAAFTSAAAAITGGWPIAVHHPALDGQGHCGRDRVGGDHQAGSRERAGRALDQQHH